MMYLTCMHCGKPLSNSVSMALGMGEVCRMGQKRQSVQRGQEPELFGGASFNVEMVDGVICIVDLDQGGRSVTNDMDNVLRCVQAQGFEVQRYPVIYRDSRGVWDGVLISATGGCADFYALAEVKRGNAIPKALSKWGKDKQRVAV